jgi:hypothetical protein
MPTFHGTCAEAPSLRDWDAQEFDGQSVPTWREWRYLGVRVFEGRVSEHTGYPKKAGRTSIFRGDGRMGC